MQWNAEAGKIMARVRKVRPLVHHITNVVVANVTANVTLAVGASPVMAHAPEEAAEMARAAKAVVLNIGTLTLGQMEAMMAAGREANRAGVPVILDPVGMGATSFRSRSVERLLSDIKVAVVRGNAAEIAVLGGYSARVAGVDAASEPEGMADIVRETSRRLGTVVAATGAIDYVSDGTLVLEVHNGHPLLTRITGTGCMATAVIAAMRAVEEDGLPAATAALACFGYAGEIAAAGARGPGSFQVRLLDVLHALQPEELAQGARIAAG